MNETGCDIIIPIYNRLDLTKRCLMSIVDTTRAPYRLILIDNGSDPSTASFLEDFKRSNKDALLVRNRNNLGWVKAANQGIRLSGAAYVCLMNNDTVVRTDGWLSKLLGLFSVDKTIGMINPHFEVKKDVSSKGRFMEVDFCRGYCLLTKRDVIDRIGLLDEAYGLGYYDDHDYSIRAIRAGFKCVKANDVYVEHVSGSTFSAVFKNDKGRQLHSRNSCIFRSKWGRTLKVLFIATRSRDKELFSRVLFSLARRQHIVYFWNPGSPFAAEHINIRERLLPKYFYAPLVYLKVLLNRLRGEGKRYDIIFTDDKTLARLLSHAGPRVYCADLEKEMKRIEGLADALSKS